MQFQQQGQMGQRQFNETLDVAGITAILKGATDQQVSTIIASVCGSRPQLQDKMLEQLVQPPAPRCSGTIKKFFPDKQFGFIDSPDTFALYQRDVFLSGNQVGGFGPGDQVSFVVTLGKNGQPQAQDLQQDGEGGGGGGGQPKQWTPELEQQMMAMANAGDQVGLDNLINMMNNQGGQGNLPQGAMGGSPGGNPHIQKKFKTDPNAPRFIGTIKNFSLERKFGFIECAEMTQQYGRDAFLSNMQLGSCQVGQTVSFAVIVNQQGQPQAADLQDAGNGNDVIRPMEPIGAGVSEMCGDFRNGNCQRGAQCRYSHEQPMQQQQQQQQQQPTAGQPMDQMQVQQQFGQPQQQFQPPPPQELTASGRPSRWG